MNKCILKGNVGQDPKISDFENGGKVAQFTLATTERGFKTQDGREIPDETTWHNVVVRKSGLANLCEQYVKKGTPLLVEGKIKTREYVNNEGKKRYITEIHVSEMELLGGGNRQSGAPAPTPEAPYKSAEESDPTANWPSGM